MTKKQNHIEKQNELNREIQEMISGTHITWDKTKDEIWPEMLKKIEGSRPAQTKVIYLQIKRLAVAAVLLILLGTPLTMFFYTKTVENPSGKHAEIYLPDKSKVVMNAQSVLAYKPLLWKFKRNINFEGEAFFEVKKGKTFEVISEKGKTVVLGTQFNIYSRDNDYKVTCISGKVKMSLTTNNKEVVLVRGQKAELQSDGNIRLQTEINTSQEIAWIDNKLSFTSVPLKNVFEEISRQYDIKIIIDCQVDNIYTGAFNKGDSPDNALNLVCRPFNLNFTRKSENEYIISNGN